MFDYHQNVEELAASVKILKNHQWIWDRIMRWDKAPYGSGRERIEYEADPRHVKLIILQLALSS